MTMSLPAIVIARNVLSANRCITTFAIRYRHNRQTEFNFTNHWHLLVEDWTNDAIRMQNAMLRRTEHGWKWKNWCVVHSFIRLLVWHLTRENNVQLNQTTSADDVARRLSLVTDGSWHKNFLLFSRSTTEIDCWRPSEFNYKVEEWNSEASTKSWWIDSAVGEYLIGTSSIRRLKLIKKRYENMFSGQYFRWKSETNCMSSRLPRTWTNLMKHLCCWRHPHPHSLNIDDKKIVRNVRFRCHRCSPDAWKTRECARWMERKMPADDVDLITLGPCDAMCVVNYIYNKIIYDVSLRSITTNLRR